MGLASAILLAALAQAPEWTESERAKLATHTPLADAPANPTNAVADDERAARLGQRLFFEKRFSANGELACASCHDPARDFADGKQVFEGLARGERNTPSLWNVAHNRWFFWDGRADSLWAQAAQPLEGAPELGSDRAHIARVLASDASLRARYTELFGALPVVADLPEHARPVVDEPEHPHQRAWAALDASRQRELTRVLANVGKSLEAYQRKLVRGDADFDRYAAALERNEAASELSESAQRGLRTFIGKANCRSCHGGPAFSDGEFHNIGVPALGGGAASDPARYAAIEHLQRDELNALGEFSDARDGEHALQLRTLVRGPQNFGEWRTPSLRNVALSAPYMHQGQFATLRDVVRYYSTLDGATRVGHHQELTLRPLNLSEAEIDDLVAFLESLTGAPPEHGWLEPPRGEGSR